jgi:hypothetical protein
MQHPRFVVNFICNACRASAHGMLARGQGGARLPNDVALGRWDDDGGSVGSGASPGPALHEITVDPDADAVEYLQSPPHRSNWPRKCSVCNGTRQRIHRADA